MRLRFQSNYLGLSQQKALNFLVDIFVANVAKIEQT